MDSVQMKRIFRALFWFVFGVALVGVPMLSFASLITVPVPGLSVGSDGLLVSTSSAGITSVVYPSLATTTPLSVPLPPVAGMVQPGRQLMVLPTVITPNVGRVAAAVIGLARLSGPIGMGLNIATLVCANTNICTSLLDPTALVKNTTIRDGPYANSTSSAIYNTPQAACDAWQTPGTTFLQTTTAAVPSRVGACMTSAGAVSCYVVSNTTTTSTTSAPPTASDFSAAIIALAAATSSMGQLVDAMNAKSMPVPVDKPVMSPASATTPAETVVNRDSTGAVTNTTTITTTTNVAPVTDTTTTNNTSNVTQITNTTVTNSTGVVSSKSDSSEPPTPDDPVIQFDTVDDVPLQNQQLPLSMPAATSWGEGSCPGDPSVSVLGHPISIPVHVVCDYMTGVRGAVLALFGLISAYIVIGVKFEG